MEHIDFSELPPFVFSCKKESILTFYLYRILADSGKNTINRWFKSTLSLSRLHLFHQLLQVSLPVGIQGIKNSAQNSLHSDMG